MKTPSLRNIASLGVVILVLAWVTTPLVAQEATPAEVREQVIPPPPEPPQLSDGDNATADLDQDIQGLSPKTRDLILTIIEGFRNKVSSGVAVGGGGGSFMGYMVTITIIVLSLGFPPIIISIVLYFGYKRERLRYNTMITLAEKGVTVPSLEFEADIRRNGPVADLRKGVIALALGAGIALFFYFLGWRSGVGIGAIPAFIGIAHLFIYYTRKSESAR